MNATATTATAPVPFHKDTRTIADKLAVDKRNWTPHKEHDQPRTIFGLCVERGVYHSSYDKDEPRETMRLLTGDNVEWSVIAFHGYLQSEILRKQPRVGDFVAAAYRGTKPAKKLGESDAHVYVIEIERDPDAPEPEHVTAVTGATDVTALAGDAYGFGAAPPHSDDD